MRKSQFYVKSRCMNAKLYSALERFLQDAIRHKYMHTNQEDMPYNELNILQSYKIL